MSYRFTNRRELRESIAAAPPETPEHEQNGWRTCEQTTALIKCAKELETALGEHNE
jgi:hypothetical protein